MYLLRQLKLMLTISIINLSWIKHGLKNVNKRAINNVAIYVKNSVGSNLLEVH